MTTPLDEAAAWTRARLEYLLAHVPEDDPAFIRIPPEEVPPPPGESLAEYLSRLRGGAGPAD